MCIDLALNIIQGDSNGKKYLVARVEMKFIEAQIMKSTGLFPNFLFPNLFAKISKHYEMRKIKVYEFYRQ